MKSAYDPNVDSYADEKGDQTVFLSGFLKSTYAVRYSGWLLGALWLYMLTACSVTPASHHVTATTQNAGSSNDSELFTGTLKVLTLNVAHGRKDGINQLFLSKQTIKENLFEISTVLKQTDADIVALQEADGPSRWSGKFDHVAVLAEQGDYPWYSRASHAHSWLFDYGTALLSRGNFTETLSHTFAPSPPTLSKGFLLGQIAWQPKEGTDAPVLVDVVSVHLDFSRSSVRQQQIAEMTEILANRKNPMIILGDFNSDWFNDASVLHELARRCRIQMYQPLADGLGTYNSNGRRLDWILLSNDLEFKNYTVLPDVVSDHYAVVAEVAFRDMDDIKERDKTCIR